MSDTGLDYERMVEDAMRGLVREALARTAAHGLPGKHHFYISFRTGASGVLIPARLRAQYPDEMTIVLQYQYWDLEIADDLFAVDLTFGGKREHLVIPFAALTAFVDPEAQFALRFGAGGVVAGKATGKGEDKPAKPKVPAPLPPGSADAPEPGPAVAEGAPAKPGEKIISLDSFRKK